MKTIDLVQKYSHIFNTNYTNDANCQGAWLMDADEDPLTDSSGEGNTLALKGAGEPDYKTATPPDTFSTGYYNFDGSDDYANGGDILDFGTGDFTIIYWGRHESFPGGGGAEWAVSKWYNGDPANYRVGVIENSGNVHFKAYLKQSSNDMTVEGSTALSVDTWYNFCSVWEDNVEQRIYVDGSSDANTSRVGTVRNNANTALFTLGADYDSGYTREMDGDLDQVAVFDRVLDSTEVNDIMDNGLEGGAAPATKRRNRLMMGVGK